MTNIRLTHPDLDFRVDVRLRDFDGLWLAVADLADEPDVGLGETAEEALRGAQASLGKDLAKGIVDWSQGWKETE